MTGAMEELRAGLDELGVKWIDTGDGSTLIPAQDATGVAWDVNVWPSGKDMGDCLWVQNRHPLTPEQVIAATVGDRNPDGLPVGLTISDDGSLLNWMGENYVRQDAAMAGAEKHYTLELRPKWEQVLYEVAQENFSKCVRELLEKTEVMGA